LEAYREHPNASLVVGAVKGLERRRLIVYPALMSLGFAVLASCAQKAPPPPQPVVAVRPPPPPPPLPHKRRVFPVPPHKPTPPPEIAAKPPEAGTEAMTLAPPEPAPAGLSAAQLIGLDQPAARRLLGAATEQSDAPPASVWRYRTAICELDLFFYLDLRSGKMRALHYAFKVDQGGQDDCLRSLVAARRT
jgi:outer membrane biosynthesis protein TonB